MESKHFTIEQLADGVFAAIHRDGGHAVSNAGLIDLGDEVLVFDAFMSPLVAQALRDSAETLTDKPITTLINSHNHRDHIWGNQVFADCTIVSSQQTRDLILETSEAELAGTKRSGPIQLAAAKVRRKNETDPTSKQHLDGQVTYFEGMLAGHPTLKITPPTLTFGNEMTFFGRKRTAKLITWGGGHSPSDTILYLPEDGIVFMGDLLFVQSHPYLGDGDPLAWVRMLGQAFALNAKVYVPGHGGVGSAESVTELRSYINQLAAFVMTQLDDGVDENTVAQTAIQPKYKAWELASFHEANLRFLYSFFG